MVAKRVPSEFGKEAVVLMCVAAPLRKNQVGIDATLEFLEEVLYLSAVIGAFGIDVDYAQLPDREGLQR